MALFLRNVWYSDWTRKTLQVDTDMMWTEFTRFVRESNYICIGSCLTKWRTNYFHHFQGIFPRKFFRFRLVRLNEQTNLDKWKEKNFNPSLFCMGTNQWTCVEKTALHPYKRRKHLSVEEKQAYVHIRDAIKAELRKINSTIGRL